MFNYPVSHYKPMYICKNRVVLPVEISLGLRLFSPKTV